MNPVKKRLGVLSIDKYALDEEWAGQAQQRYIYHEKMSNALQMRDNVLVDQEEAKNEYRRVHARLILQIKQDPESFGLSKATDALCDAVALDHPDRRDAFDAYIECGRRLSRLNHEVNRLQGMLESFIDRRKGLDNMISLYLNNYFSQNPRIKRMAEDVLGAKSNEEFTRALTEDEELMGSFKKRKRIGFEEEGGGDESNN